jgi:hypothetical protein
MVRSNLTRDKHIHNHGKNNEATNPSSNSQQHTVKMPLFPTMRDPFSSNNVAMQPNRLQKFGRPLELNENQT